MNLFDLILRDPNIAPSFKRQFVPSGIAEIGSERRRDVEAEEHADQLRDERIERDEAGE